MTYSRDTGEISAHFHPGADADAVTMGSGTVARFVAPGTITNGQFGLFEWNMVPGAGGTDAHFHKTFSESFYVTSGTVRLYDGNKWVNATKGDFLYIPEGGVHAFHNDSGEAASMLILFAPGAPREKYFIELAANSAAGIKLTEDEWDELWARHDQYAVR